MTFRPLPLALLAALFVPTVGSAPVTLKYKFTQSFEQTIDLSVMGQDVQTQQANYDVYVTVTARDSADGHAVMAKVDSLVPAPGSDPMITGALTSALKNAADSGFVNTEGEASGFASGPGGASLKGLMQAIFPKVKKGAKPGDVWTDTTTTVDSAQGGAITRKSITNYTASAGDKWQGETTLKLVTAASMTISGSQSGADIDGNGHHNSTLTLSKAGNLVSAVTSMELDMTATTPQAPAPLPIVNKISSTATLLP